MKLKLLFIYTDEKIFVDDENNMYSTGNFAPGVWDRYLSLTDGLRVIMTRNPAKLNSSQLSRSVHKIDRSKIDMRLIPHNKDSLRHYFSAKIRKERFDIFEEQIKNADAVIIRMPNSRLVNLCKKYNKQYAVEVVGCVWDALWNHSFKGKILALPNFIDLKKTVRNAPFVLYVTDKFLQERYPAKGVTVGCSNVLLRKLDDAVLQKRLDKIKNHSGRIILGTAAALNVKYKGQRFVIRALAELKRQGLTNYEYQVIGGGDASALLAEAKKADVAEQVKIVGLLNHDRVFEWLEAIDIYVQPSLQEGLPRSVVEAMSCGLPCMGTDIAGIPEIVDESMLFKRKGSHEIAEILKGLDKEKMLELSQKSFEKAKGFERDALNKKRRDFYMEFLKNAE